MLVSTQPLINYKRIIPKKNYKRTKKIINKREKLQRDGGCAIPKTKKKKNTRT